MPADEKYMDVLQNLEAVVVAAWRRHPEMADYTALRAYEAAIAHYQALARGGVPKPENLAGLDAEVYAAVTGVCEWRLGRRPLEGAQPAKDEPAPAPISTDELVACLKRLRKSVERWNRTGGRQGYLEFVSQYVG